jgi:signal transduction histidine kinase/CheY-like chemotaxis protein
MAMAAAVVGVILVAEGLAWVGLDRLERALGAQQVETLADVRRVLTLAETASRLAASAHEIVEIHDRGAFLIQERALEGRLEDFTALATALPVRVDRPASPSIEPTIVRLADRLDGVLRHLLAATGEEIDRRAEMVGGRPDGIEPRRRFLLAATTVAASELGGLVRDYASLVERSGKVRAEAMAADLGLGKIAAGLIGALALVVALAFANAFLRGVVADLLGIAEAMRALAAGDTGVTAPGGRRTDEIGVLARAFAVFRVQARERAEIENRLHRAERLEAIGRLTGGIAHDFNNILTAVAANLQLILDGAEAGSPTSRRALRALSAAENGAAMVQRLLAFGRRQMLAPEATDVEALAAALLDLVAASLGAGIRLDLVRSEPDDRRPPIALVDPSQLEAALLNLVLNARDAVGPRGRIRLVIGRTADRRIRIEVEDDGTGMDEATLGRIFEPFFTTKPAGTGSGLGLSMVYGFVRQSGGHVEVASRPGEGTRITIDLPEAEANGPIAGAAPPPPPAALPPGLVVLVVEDDVAVGASVVDLLESLGARASVVRSAAAAVERFSADPTIDFVLTDLTLAGDLDGVGLVEALRAIRPDLPVLIVTGYAGATTIDLPLLPKPFRREELEAAIGRALGAATARPVGGGPTAAGDGAGAAG